MNKSEAKSVKHAPVVKMSEKAPLKTKYAPNEIELKWQAIWEEEGIYQPDLSNAKRPYYNLMMFPYPSAEGLHVGFSFTSAGVDTFGRYKRMQGYDVFQPMGLDGFGIHAENHAIKTESHPFEHAKRTEENFYRQLHETGNAYSWNHKLETYDPGYYKWTQWLFIELFKAGLAYRAKSPVNFCPWCKTVLADEQVVDGKCERCDSVVEKRNLEQWFFRITKYSEQLLNNIENLNWTERVKVAQKNWIGKKTGVYITYPVIASDSAAIPSMDKPTKGIASLARNEELSITVFTTRPDTNFGATFVALAPEHPFVALLLNKKLKTKNLKQIIDYVEKTKMKSEVERQSEGKEKTGVFTGYYAINQLTGFKMPIWVSDFVLSGFGTGALVGVPGHDRRDFDFARQFDLNIKRVVVGKDGDTSLIKKAEQVQEDSGTMINSEFLDGMDSKEARDAITGHMEKQGYGEPVTQYHLRDWLISRQRYWGPPIPMVFCESCAEKGKSWFSTQEAEKYKVSSSKYYVSKDKKGKNILNTNYLIHNTDMSGWYPVSESELPVKLPYIEDYKPLGSGKSPLANDPDFVKATCPECGEPARRETDVSDTFLDSAWYFFRYTSTERADVPFDKSIVKKWLPVTSYIGGAEHSVLHLLYSRFITMALKDLGHIDFDEPFKRFYAHGLIIKDGAKMSKSKGNVINPDLYIHKFGVDTLRAYLLFLGPFNQGGDFRDTGIEGMNRFLKRVWTMFTGQNFSSKKPSEAAKSMMHQSIKTIGEDYEELRFNTAIAKLMTWYNFLSKQEQISHEEASTYLQLLAPLAPHMAEELWHILGNQPSIHVSTWPIFDTTAIVKDTLIIAVQVNGKLRATFDIPAEEKDEQEKIEKQAQREAKKFLEGKSIKKIIYVPGKIVNIVAL